MGLQVRRFVGRFPPPAAIQLLRTRLGLVIGSILVGLWVGQRRINDGGEPDSVADFDPGGELLDRLSAS